MRLSPRQIAVIKQAVHDLVGAEADLRLFGSRTNDDARGGDIDLWVASPVLLANRVWLGAQLTARLQMALGDQRIDVRLVDPGTNLTAIDDVARQQGIQLT